MFGQHLYFLLKPFLPWRLRLVARRLNALRLLRRSGGVWPIDPSAGEKPEGWCGWPAGKQFALVLTHDVESRRGLKQVRRLAEVEMELGFRSSFNFVPEGEYEVPDALRAWLSSRGFEVGVHDLYHDGMLFNSRSGFCRKAERINSYLKAWGAVGFRSGYMLRNLEWIQDLAVVYDSSTFDTDPFEPQPDGVGTIFPFWVHKHVNAREGPMTRAQGGGLDGVSSNSQDLYSHVGALLEMPHAGYVELPYTMPQDLTLFKILGNRTNSIWKTKLDWIVERGGMALLNVHPDYLAFGDEDIGEPSYPFQLYREFLVYVKSHYRCRYWHALPRVVAEVCSPHPNYQRQCPTS